MKRISPITMVVILATSAAVQAEPVLVGSFDFGLDGVLIEETQIGFVLQLLDVDNNSLFLGPPLGGLSDDIRQGPSKFWEDGESGVLEFTSASDPLFDEFTSLLTDGVDDSLLIYWRWMVDGGFGGSGNLESELLGLDTDLFGNDIDLIRLTVHDVSIGPFVPGDLPVAFDVTYEFFGTPVPEPASFILLFVGAIAAFSKRKTLTATTSKLDLGTVKLLILSSILILPTIAYGDQKSINDGPKSFYTTPEIRGTEIRGTVTYL